MSTNENEPEVKDIERIEIAPAEGENVDEDEKDTQSDSSQTKNNEEGDKPESKDSDTSDDDTVEEPEKKTEAKTAAPKTEDTERYGDVKRSSGESDREFALRIENARLRDEVRGNMSKGVFTPPATQAKKELSPEKKKVLDQYKPEDIQKLEQVFDAMAEGMGFVRKTELGASSFQEKAGEILDEFLEKHPEYMPENDRGGILWKRFQDEFSIYKTPENPKVIKKILDKVHREVFGIKSAAAINNNEAAKEKIKVASHSGSPRPTPSREGVKRNVAPQGLRTDMLKGFSDEEIAEFGA